MFQCNICYSVITSKKLLVIRNVKKNSNVVDEILLISDKGVCNGYRQLLLSTTVMVLKKNVPCRKIHLIPSSNDHFRVLYCRRLCIEEYVAYGLHVCTGETAGEDRTSRFTHHIPWYRSAECMWKSWHPPWQLCPCPEQALRATRWSTPHTWSQKRAAGRYSHIFSHKLLMTWRQNAPQRKSVQIL